MKNQDPQHFDQGNLLESSLVWKKIIDKIDHLFINKLSTLRSKNTNLNRALPSLLKAYHLAIEHKLIEPEIEQHRLEMINDQANTHNETEAMFQVLDATHSFCDELFSTGNNKTLSAVSCVNRAIDTYPFKNNDRAIIHFNHDTDFNFLFSELFLNSSLIQLLNFTFNNFEESTQKKIDIFFSSHDHSNAIHFKITSPEVRSQYDHFFANSLIFLSDKIVPGINFCRLALLNNGGDITYMAREGQELEFIISLPKPI